MIRSEIFDERELLDARLERAFVGALIATPDLQAELRIGGEQLADPQALMAWDAISNLRDRGVAVDLVAVRDELAARCGHHDLEWLDAIVVEAKPTNLVRGWEQRLLLLFERRARAVDDADLPSRLDAEVDDLAARDTEVPIVAGVPRVADPVLPRDLSLVGPATKVEGPKRAARRALRAEDVARLETPPIRSFATGLPALDDLTGGGVATRQLLTLMGPPGAGKSACAVSISLHVESTLPVLYASTELERDEVKARLAAQRLGRSWAGIVRGHVPHAEVVEALRGVRIWILGSDDLPRGEAALPIIEAEARAIAEEMGVAPLVVIDYLQDLVRGAESDLRTKTGDLATECRAMSQRLDCPMLIVSSVSRTFYNPRVAAQLREVDDPTVYLAAAKESGDVDYASATVVFLDVDDDRTKEHRPVRIAVAKARHGTPGFAGASFHGATGRYSSDTSAVAALSAPGRAERKADDSVTDADEKVFRTVVRMHSEGKRDLATYSQLKTCCGIGTPRIKPALDRLVHAGRLAITPIERLEGKQRKAREIYEVVQSGAGN